MTYDLANLIGRFGPWHDGHKAVAQVAFKNAKFLNIMIGSAGKARDDFNPWTFAERKAMILGSLTEEQRNRTTIQPLYDTYNNQNWVKSVQEASQRAVQEFGIDHKPSITLVGHSKDKTSYYLDMFPQWESINVPGYTSEEFVLSATSIRELIYLTEDQNDLRRKIEAGALDSTVSPFVKNMLLGYIGTALYDNLVGEFKFNTNYRKPYEALPHPVKHVTVDACVIQSGHVLLIERRSRPGKGLIALPGGHLEVDEYIADAWVRELREETKLKVPEAVLRGNLALTHVFDAPRRSARGRVISHAHLVILPNGPLPPVKAASDAKRAFWRPLAELRREEFFEDHFEIIEALIEMNQTKR